MDDIPAPNLSNSYSFNEKMLFVHKSKINPEILGIGSSMSLNNLDTKTIVNHFDKKKYLNTASWGFSIKDNYLFLKALKEIYHPQMIMMASNNIDFQQEEKKINYQEVVNYIKSENASKYYLGYDYFNLKYFFTNFKYAREVRSCNKDYQYLNFDENGGVNFESEGFNIKPGRWNEDYIRYAIQDEQYKYFDSINSFCAKNKIKFSFFQTPLRSSYAKTLNAAQNKILSDHYNKVSEIVHKYDHKFVNANDLKDWDDSLYVDVIHLNKIGSKIFTQYCLSH